MSEKESKVLAEELERIIVSIVIRILPTDKQNARRIVVPRTVLFLFRLCFVSGTRGESFISPGLNTYQTLRPMSSNYFDGSYVALTNGVSKTIFY